MNLNSESSKYSNDHLDELVNELDDEFLEIADANVRRRMSQMRVRKRTISAENRDAIDEEGEVEPLVKSSNSASNFSVRRSSAISLADQEQEILQKVLAKRSESIAIQSEQTKAPVPQTASKKNSTNEVSIIFRKKIIYTYLSLSFGLLLLLIHVYENISLLWYETVPETIKYLASFLILQVISFYLFILGFVYANESGDRNSFLLAVSSGVLNIVVIGLRTNYQFRYDGLIPITSYVAG